MKTSATWRRTAAALLALAGAGGVAGIASAQPKAGISDDVVKIGLLLDMSGLYADVTGRGSATAAQMAIDDFGGKVLGKKIELVVVDHQNKADIAANKAREWFDTDKVDAILDVAASAPALAVLDVAKQKNKIVVFSGPGSERLTNDLCTPVSVHYAYDTYALANTTAKAMVQRGGTRHPLSTSDFASYLLQAQASKAQVVGLANAGGDTVNAIKAASEFGLTRDGKQRMAGLLLYINDIHALGLKTAQGLVLTEAFYWDMNDATRAWSRKYFDKVKKMPNMSQAGVYSSVTHYLKAVQAAGTDETAPTMEKMKAMPINDFFAKNGRIRADGRMVHDMYLFEVKTPAESKYPWDYYKVLATVPGDQAFIPPSKSQCPLLKGSR
jgi:branched-chain amino acid transport system substrate-binding protein